jgi:CheY-like chemotaxis protein
MGVAAFASLAEARAAGEARVDLWVVDAALDDGAGDPRASEAPRLLTATMHRLGEAMRRVGPSAVISKPIKRSQLHDALQRIFGGAGQATRAAAATSTPSPARVLLVEDSPVNQRVALRMLDVLGYRADVAGDGAEAVRAARRRPYDVILMDLQMPVLDGIGATREIRAGEPAGPPPWIIAMTAEALSGDEARCRAAGMNDYVAKPVQLAALRAALERAARAREGRGP